MDMGKLKKNPCPGAKCSTCGQAHLTKFHVALQLRKEKKDQKDKQSGHHKKKGEKNKSNLAQGSEPTVSNSPTAKSMVTKSKPDNTQNFEM